MTRILSTFIALFISQATLAIPTTVRINMDGFDLTRFGGTIGTLSLALEFPENAPDLEPGSNTIGLYHADGSVSFNGSSTPTEGWLQLRNLQNLDQIFFTVQFPAGVVPGTSLNTPLFGIELGLSDPSAQMLDSIDPHMLQSNFADSISSFTYYLRLGGWPANSGTWREFTADSLTSAVFSSEVAAISVATPGTLLLFCVALSAAYRRKKSNILLNLTLDRFLPSLALRSSPSSAG